MEYALGMLALIAAALGGMLLRATEKAARASAQAKQEMEYAARMDAEKNAQSARQAQGDVERQLQDRPHTSSAAVERLRKLRDNQ